MIENENVPTNMETQQLRGVSTRSKVLNEFERRRTKPTFEIDINKWTYEINMIEYKALMEMHLFNIQLKKNDENGKPEFATMTIPANKMYETAGIKTTKNYYQVLAEDKPADNNEELADKIIYVDPFGNDDTTTELTTQT